jgi:hypothetical protein
MQAVQPAFLVCLLAGIQLPGHTTTRKADKAPRIGQLPIQPSAQARLRQIAIVSVVFGKRASLGCCKTNFYN